MSPAAPVTPEPGALDAAHALMERSPVPMAELEGAGHLVRYANPAFCRLAGKSREAVTGKPFVETMQDGDTCLAALDRVYRTGEAETHTESEQPDPHPAYWSYAMWPVMDAEQHPAGVMMQVTETTKFHQQAGAVNEALLISSVRQHEQTETAQKLNEQLQEEIVERKRAEEHRDLLINELNHRVKNTLATVQSFASQTLRNAKNMTEARAVFDSRLVALAKAHDVLTREHWAGANLHDVVANAVAAYSDGDRECPFRIHGPYLRLQPKPALALSMALHELATNAVKYGALSNEAGRVEIGWSIIPGITPRFQFRWSESGGPSVEKPKRRGFGSRLVEQGLARDLEGEARLEFEKSGLVCRIEAPLAEVSGGGEE